ncbi:MAG: hypothetical protein LBP35_02445 [Candidatus Ancillula trichonymphae]|nr:hypothetical protein [Candidatus Ancillula trichonymphae]
MRQLPPSVEPAHSAHAHAQTARKRFDVELVATGAGSFTRVRKTAINAGEVRLNGKTARKLHQTMTSNS